MGRHADLLGGHAREEDPAADQAGRLGRLRYEQLREVPGFSRGQHGGDRPARPGIVRRLLERQHGLMRGGNLKVWAVTGANLRDGEGEWGSLRGLLRWQLMHWGGSCRPACLREAWGGVLL